MAKKSDDQSKPEAPAGNTADAPPAETAAKTDAPASPPAEAPADEKSRQTQKANGVIGRIVRYTLGAGEERAAVIAKVEDATTGLCTLSVFKAVPSDLVNAQGVIAGNGCLSAIATVGGVAFNEAGSAGTWRWPEKS